MTEAPAPPPFKPGDKLRVTMDHPYGSALVTGDLVTVQVTGLRLAEPGGMEIPVVQVASAHGIQLLGLDAVEPYTSPPAYVPAEPDEVSDAILAAMAAADPELAALGSQIDADLAAVIAAEQAAEEPEDSHDDAHPAVQSRRFVGRPYSLTDFDGDELEVLYFEQTCPAHGREAGFRFAINEQEAVVIPVDHIDGLLRYLFLMKKHSQREE